MNDLNLERGIEEKRGQEESKTIINPKDWTVYFGGRFLYSKMYGPHSKVTKIKTLLSRTTPQISPSDSATR